MHTDTNPFTLPGSLAVRVNIDNGYGGRDVRMYCADRHLDITFGLQVVERSSLVSILFREKFSLPYISYFHLQVNV